MPNGNLPQRKPEHMSRDLICCLFPRLGLLSMNQASSQNLVTIKSIKTELYCYTLSLIGNSMDVGQLFQYNIIFRVWQKAKSNAMGFGIISYD